MKTEDIIKWALIAGAAYLVYKYLSQSGLFTSLTAAQPVTSTTTETTPTVTVNPQKVSITADALTTAARAQMGTVWDGKLTISQWNYFVSKLTGVDQQTDLSFGESVPDPVTVDDYMARRVKAGISGLKPGGLDFSALAALLPASNWAM